MGDRTTIEWTATYNADGTVTPGATWNPFRAKAMREVPDPANSLLKILQPADGYYCEKVSPECKNCYAEKMNRGPWNANGLRYSRENREKAALYIKQKTLEEPLRWKRPRKIFGFSMTDLYGDFFADWMLDEVHTTMALADWHTFLILTKRPLRRLAYLQSKYGAFPTFAQRNIWHGVTVGCKESIERIDVLRATPAAKRFLSVEPLLEDLGQLDLTGIDWVIVGGESGPNARPMHPDWARSIRDQCLAAGVAFFFKQFGEWAPCGLTNGLYSESKFHRFVDGQHMERVGKHDAGAELDGQTWKQFPGIAA